MVAAVLISSTAKIYKCPNGPSNTVVTLNKENFKTFGPLIILILAIMSYFLLSGLAEEPEKQELKPDEPLVDAVRVESKTITIPVEAQGSVEARTQTRLLADVAGRVRWLDSRFEAGGYFKKGDVMARIDDRSYVAAVKRAEAQVASAESMLATETGRAEVALKEWELRGQKVKRSEAATALFLRKPQLAEAQARLDSAKADLMQAKVDLGHTVVNAPYDCLVKGKSIDLGQSLSPGAAIAEVFAVDAALVRVPLPENDLQFLALPEMNGNAHAPRVQLNGTGAMQSKTWEGRLIRTEGVLDPKTRSLMAVIEVKDPYGLSNKEGSDANKANPLRIGSFVTAKIDGSAINGLYELSQAAINPGNKIWVINDEQRLEARKVSIRTRTNESAYIEEGLSDGELVSLTSLSSFATGARVRIATVNGETPQDQLQLESAAKGSAPKEQATSE